jgi:enterochelin esterase-like enzyme
MKIINLIFVFFALVSLCFAQDNSIPASSNIRGSKYPQITSDSRAIFKIKAPDVQKLQLDLGRKYDMVKNTEGVWEVTTDSLSEGFHYYSLIIDGVAVADPASETFYGMGRQASGIEVPFNGDDYYKVKNVPHGDIRIKRYYSEVLSVWRNFYMYTPPGYDENTREKYPVLYILHGGGEDQRGWAMQGKTDLIVDNLLAEKKAAPMIVVMVDGNMSTGGFGEESLKVFENELTQCIIPFVEKNYRVKPEPQSRALAGLSMGGIQTLYAGINNTDLFSYLGVFSSGWIQPMQKELADSQYEFMKNNIVKINNNLKQFWISEGGKEDIAWQNGQNMISKFDEMKIKYTYSEYPGGHSWPVWRNNLYNFAQLLFK